MSARSRRAARMTAAARPRPAIDPYRRTRLGAAGVRRLAAKTDYCMTTMISQFIGSALCPRDGSTVKEQALTH
jgi:hypothetical protein